MHVTGGRWSERVSHFKEMCWDLKVERVRQEMSGRRKHLMTLT